MKYIILSLLSTLVFAEVLSPDQVITIRDSETGIKEYDYSTARDKYTLDLGYTLNGNVMDAASVAGYKAQLTIQSDNFSWVGYASQVTVNAANALDRSELEEDDLTVTELGLGLSRRTSLIRHFINSPSFYDEISFVGSYSSATATFLDNSLSGYGLISSYGIFLRNAVSTHWGVVMNYHLHTLTDNDEQAPSELTASWVSMTLTLGFNF